MSGLEQVARAVRPTAAEAVSAWRAIVGEHHALMERLGEPPPDDVWEPAAQGFRPREGELDPEIPVYEELLRPSDVWMDIGAGGGRFTVPLAQRVERVVAVEPSAAMRVALGDAIAAEHLSNVRVVEGAWPPESGGAASEPVDVVLAANVLYTVLDIEQFLDAMEQHARRLCVVLLGDRGRGPVWLPIWEGLYDEPQVPLPGLREFVALLGARDRRYEVRTVELPPARPGPLERAQRLARRMLYVVEGSDRDRRLGELLMEHYGMADGLVMTPARRRYNAVVSWAPAAPAER